MDWGSEGLLAGLEGEDAQARARLLDALHDDGVSIGELRAAVAEDRLVLLPIERALLAPSRFTLAELVEGSGLGEELAHRRLRALGITVPEDPDQRAFSEDDLAAVRRAKDYAEKGLSVDDGIPLVRMMSGSMARVAEPMRRLFVETYLEAGDTEDALGLRFGERTGELMPFVAADLDYLLRMHLRDFARSDALSFAARQSGRLPDFAMVAVSFVDIVGFTALGEQVPETELTDIAGRLEALAEDHIRSPVRIVKTIGDAVMVVSSDVKALVDAMVALDAAAAADEQLPSVRTGISYGRAVARLGDWYGPAVNLAARLTSRARADSILATNSVRDALGDGGSGYRFTEAGLKRFKGIADPVPVLRLRSAEAGPAAAEA